MQVVRTLTVTLALILGAGIARESRADAAPPRTTSSRLVEVDAQLAPPSRRSPGLAALLSLTPVPIDFGNFYAENVDWGIAYTAGEVVVGGAMMWIGASHMCHHDQATASCSSWSVGERNAMIGLAGAYVAVKILAALEASSAATSFNERQATPWTPVVTATNGGAVVGWAAAF